MSDNRSTYPNISTSVFSIEQEMNFTQLNIRFDPTDISILPIFNDVMDLNLDIAPNTVSKHSGNFALWLGPDERLVLVANDKILDLAQRLERELNGRHYSFVEVSSGQVIFDLKGKEVRNVISKGCSVDLHHKYFNIGQCVQTAIDKINVICFPIEENHIRIIVRTSYARALIGWFEDACLEFI